MPARRASVGLILVMLVSLPAARAAAERPNLLLIYADDLGHGDVSAYGAAETRTPSLDRLAREGMLFTRMRANATVCSPSRAALLTGRFPDRVGVPGVIRTRPADSWGWFLPTVPTLADLVRAQGYTTALIGKWHLGLEPPNTPNARGFTVFRGFLGDLMDSSTTPRRGGDNLMRWDDREVDPVGHATDLFSDWACDFIRARSTDAQPFLLHLAYNASHLPMEPPSEFLERVRHRLPAVAEKRAKAIAMVEHLDARIGAVLAAVHDAGLAQRTLVVFTADNGGALEHAQDNSPWRGGKQSHFDGGLRVPFIVRWPGVVAPDSRCDAPLLTFDVFPTFLEAAGAAIPPETDALSLRPWLTGGSSPTERDLYFVRREGGNPYQGQAYHALIRGRWKLLKNHAFMRYQLYNLALDPQETTDLATIDPQRVSAMAEALRAYIRAGEEIPWRPPGTPVPTR
jgi:arylsulfatase A-like enzyme